MLYFEDHKCQDSLSFLIPFAVLRVWLTESKMFMSIKLDTNFLACL